MHCREFKWQDTFNSITRFHYIICDKILKCDYETCWKKQENLNIIDNILLSKCWGIKEVFHSVNFCLWNFLPEVLKKASVAISKQLLGKHLFESVISAFLKSYFFLIEVFLGISHLFSGVVPGIHFLWLLYLSAL